MPGITGLSLHSLDPPTFFPMPTQQPLGPVRLVRTLIATLLLTFGAAPAASGQSGTGTVEGVARRANDGAPLSLLLVRLVHTERRTAPQEALTDTQGRFRFVGVPAGEYRLQVEQIGYERTQSPVLGVKPGATLHHEIRSAMVPVQLAEITVGGRCLTAAQLADEPAVHALWNEARKGIEARRAFALQYRFTRVLRQEVAMKPRVGKTHRELTVDTIISEPDSVLVRERRRLASRQAEGYGKQGRTTFTLSLPNETELLDEGFLRDHCLESSIDGDEGSLALRFRPVRPARDRVDIQGTIWVDAKTYLIRRLELEYLDGRRSAAQATVHYEDTPVMGSVLRLPSRGEVKGHPGGVLGVAFARVSSTFTFAHRNFERVGSR